MPNPNVALIRQASAAYVRGGALVGDGHFDASSVIVGSPARAAEQSAKTVVQRSTGVL
jgi:hypothetical protein